MPSGLLFLKKNIISTDNSGLFVFYLAQAEIHSF